MIIPDVNGVLDLAYRKIICRSSKENRDKNGAERTSSVKSAHYLFSRAPGRVIPQHSRSWIEALRLNMSEV